MAERVDEASRNAMLDVLAANVNAGAAAAYLEVYTGAQPANVAAAATGTLLVTITLNDPAFTGAAAAGALTVDVDPLPSGSPVASGTAGWGRIYDSNGVARIDGTVAEVGGDFTITNDAVTVGVDVSLKAADPITVTFPAA